MSYSYKVAVERKNQTKYIEDTELGVYLQLGWRQCTGIPASTTVEKLMKQEQEDLCECDQEPCVCGLDTEQDTHTETIPEESAEDIQASAVLKPVKRRK